MDAGDPYKDARVGARGTHEARERWDTTYIQWEDL